MTSTRLGLVVFACCICVGQLFSAEISHLAPKSVVVEMRLAEAKPAKGLQAATIQGTDKKIYLHKTVVITNKDLASARATKSGERLAVEVSFTRDGAAKMTKISKDHLGKMLAIIIDGKVVAAPILQSEVSDKAVLTGNFTKQEIDRIVNGIKAR